MKKFEDFKIDEGSGFGYGYFIPTLRSHSKAATQVADAVMKSIHILSPEEMGDLLQLFASSIKKEGYSAIQDYQK